MIVMKIMPFVRGLFMFILYVGLIVGLVYGAFETYDLIKDLMVNKWNWELLRDNFREISYAALDLAVLGQSYVVVRYFIKDEDEKAKNSKDIDL